MAIVFDFWGAPACLWRFAGVDIGFPDFLRGECQGRSGLAKAGAKSACLKAVFHFFFMNSRCFSAGMACLAAWAALAGCQPQSAPAASIVRIEGPTMGSTYHISYVPGPGGQPAAGQAQEAVQAMLRELDAAVSTYRDDSDLARFNAAPAPVCMDMPDTALELARHALALAQQSEGAFDVTLLPVLEAWGFRHGAAARPAHEASPAPAPAELEAARERMGMQHLRVQPGQLCKDAPIRVEFNSIAAGYAVDRVASYFAQQGVGSYLVEITGEMKAVGLKPDGAPWRIAIEAPLEGERQAQRIVQLNGLALSTSGDYRNWHEVDGQRQSHIMDPRTLAPVRHRLAAVTVAAPSALEADGLSTLFMALGPQQGFDYAQARGIAALFVSRRENGAGFATRATAAFDAAFGASPQGEKP